MKLPASCHKHLAVLLAIGAAVTAASRLSLATPPVADHADGMSLVLVVVDHCEAVELYRASIIGIGAIPSLLEDTVPAPDPFTDSLELLAGEGFNPCGTVLMIVPLPEPDQNTIVALDAAVWSRSKPRVGAATAFP